MRRFAPNEWARICLPLEGKALTPLKLLRDCNCRAGHFSYCGERSVAALPLREGVLLFPSAGGAKPIAGRGGLEGFTPPHRLRRGQRLSTDGMPPPAPREAPGSGLRWFHCRKRSTGKTRSAKGSGSTGHLIHRGAVPLPLIGKGLSAV